MEDKEKESPYTEWEREEQSLARSQDFKSYYTNALRVGITFLDIRIFFAESMSNVEGKSTITEQCAVVMSPENAKVLVNNLTHMIQQYEEKFGKIRDASEST